MKGDTKETRYILVVPGIAYVGESKLSQSYREKIRRLAHSTVQYWVHGRAHYLMVDYFYRQPGHGIDSDALLETVRKGLGGLSSGMVSRQIRLHDWISINSLQGIPLSEKKAERLAEEDAFTVIRMGPVSIGARQYPTVAKCGPFKAKPQAQS